MASPGKALHKGLLAKIDTLIDCEVYDAVPQGAAYPYVLIDTDAVSNEDYFNLRMERRFIYLSIWSRAYGSAEVRGIIDQIDAINESPITLDTGDMVSVRVERTHCNREPDNLTYMGSITLRILTTH
jgi:Protein of unknown function (DUF3168)